MKSKPHKWKSRSLPYFWLSFVGDEGFRGVVIMRGRSDIDCIRRSHALGINPGGQVLSCEMLPEFEPPAKATNKLLTKEDLERLLPATSPMRLGDSKPVAKTGHGARLEQDGKRIERLSDIVVEIDEEAASGK